WREQRPPPAHRTRHSIACYEALSHGVSTFPVQTPGAVMAPRRPTHAQWRAGGLPPCAGAPCRMGSDSGDAQGSSGARRLLSERTMHYGTWAVSVTSSIRMGEPLLSISGVLLCPHIPVQVAPLRSRDYCVWGAMVSPLCPQLP